MYIAHRWGDRNLSRMELIMALLLLAVLIGSFSQYMLIVFARAEQRMINSTVLNINTALHYRSAIAVMRNEYQELEKLKKMNPMQEYHLPTNESVSDSLINNMPLTVLANTIYIPANYGGEINTYTIDTIEKGKWYFNQDNKYLIYLVRNDEYFDSDSNDLSLIQFRVSIEYDDVNFNDEFEPELDSFKTMKLQAVNMYQWKY